jgi:hypothetical protein
MVSCSRPFSGVWLSHITHPVLHQPFELWYETIPSNRLTCLSQMLGFSGLMENEFSRIEVRFTVPGLSHRLNVSNVSLNVPGAISPPETAQELRSIREWNGLPKGYENLITIPAIHSVQTRFAHFLEQLLARRSLVVPHTSHKLMPTM